MAQKVNLPAAKNTTEFDPCEPRDGRRKRTNSCRLSSDLHMGVCYGINTVPTHKIKRVSLLPMPTLAPGILSENVNNIKCLLYDSSELYN